MVKMLMKHGANLEYVDHALRNALYWSVYNCCGEIAVFLLDLGTKVKPWTWIADEALPASFVEDPVVYSRVSKAREAPHSLFILARFVLLKRPRGLRAFNLYHPKAGTQFIFLSFFNRCRARSLLSQAADGSSIIPRIAALDVPEETKSFLTMDMAWPTASTQQSSSQSWRKLRKVCSETKV